ncbi:unnamed protein product [Peronospora destructor]|uniref:Uncharacterized protein n=1 Tax=Peronospora destructor TaxID=86335 RepID=A0AAV0UT61_9STRA|nr:unnamed protein product [Peronospora destructor]
MMLPGLTELLALQKQRNESVVADASLAVLSRVSTANQEQEQQIQTEEEIELEDKTPWPSAKQYHDIFFTPRTELQIPVYDDLGVDPRGVPLHPELPKKQPIVRCITATSYSRATDVAAKKKAFRMHAVMLADEKRTGENGEYVLVHIRAGGYKRVGFRATLADAKGQALAPASPDAHGTADAQQMADLLCMGKRKLLHVESSSSQGGSSDHVTMALTGSPMKGNITSTDSLFTTSEDPNVDSARLALLNMILKSCTSPDEMAKYVIGLQEELAALQSQNQ